MLRDCGRICVRVIDCNEPPRAKHEGPDSQLLGPLKLADFSSHLSRRRFDLRQIEFRHVGAAQEPVPATCRDVDLMEASGGVANGGPIRASEMFKVKADQLCGTALEIGRERMPCHQPTAARSREGCNGITNLRGQAANVLRVPGIFRGQRALGLRGCKAAAYQGEQRLWQVVT
jgi:hypothetical protein